MEAGRHGDDSMIEGLEVREIPRPASSKPKRKPTGELMTDRVVLGTAQWGMEYGIANDFGQPPIDEVEAILETAGRSGIHLLETARAYGDSEEVIGQLVGADSNWNIITRPSAVGKNSDGSCPPKKTASTMEPIAMEKVARRWSSDQWRIRR